MTLIILLQGVAIVLLGLGCLIFWQAIRRLKMTISYLIIFSYGLEERLNALDGGIDGVKLLRDKYQDSESFIKRLEGQGAI